MRRTLLLAVLLASPAALAAADQIGAPAGQGPEIVVTGQRLQDFRDRLARCIARHCPTDEDADASLALAEALFLNGDYHEARDVLRASLGRNRRHARTFPEPVSDLFRAHARLSRHMGHAADTRRSSYGVLTALQEGLPTEDHRHFTARLELAEHLIQSGNIVSARRELARLVEVARAAGRDDVVALAELRALWFDYVAERNGEEGGRGQRARAELVRLSQLTEPEQRLRATGARILLSRIYRIEGDGARADAMLAELGRSDPGRAHRRLLHSPPYELQVQQAPAMNSAMSIREWIQFPSGHGQQSDNFENKWIDVGFWVLPDGRVAGLEILRQGQDRQWADPLIRSIRGRRYAPAAEASYRLERYSYTADWEVALRSRIPTRSRRARVEYIDLTTGNERPGPPPTAENPADS